MYNWTETLDMESGVITCSTILSKGFESLPCRNLDYLATFSAIIQTHPFPAYMLQVIGF